jgi:ATP-dependent RNA helicase DDX24/MAK5
MISSQDLFLYQFLLRYPGRTLVFVNSIDAVRRIAPLLTNLGLPALGLHSQLRQKQRLKSIERFRSAVLSILVATDVAARGLDIPHVQHVFHYHLPRTADTYVHRTGRTARGSEVGVSILLCGPDEQRPLVQMLSKLNKSEILHNFPIDRTEVAKLKHRVDLAQKITHATREDQRIDHEHKFFAEAADDLGVDSEELDQIVNSKG